MRNRRTRQMRRIGHMTAITCLLWTSAVTGAELCGERLPDNGWRLLAVAYPPDREVEVVLGGAEKTLSSKGLAKVKWRENAAAVEVEIQDLPAPAEAGWSGQQFVLWAIDSEKRIMNLGLVPLNGKHAKWRVEVPFRVFGLLVTAEENAQASAPSSGVALETRLPMNPNLVVPVFRVNLRLNP